VVSRRRSSSPNGRSGRAKGTHRRRAERRPQPVRCRFAAQLPAHIRADIGMGCALGWDWRRRAWSSLVRPYAPADVREARPRQIATGEGEGENRSVRPKRAGGSDLGTLETTATRHGDAWLAQNGSRVCVQLDGQGSSSAGQAEGAPDSAAPLASFLVLRTRATARVSNGIRIRRAQRQSSATRSWPPERWESSTGGVIDVWRAERHES